MTKNINVFFKYAKYILAIAILISLFVYRDQINWVKISDYSYWLGRFNIPIIHSRDINEAALADTTRLQEAIIMDSYKYKGREEMLVFGCKGELREILNKDTKALVRFRYEHQDLIERGILRKVKLAERKVEYNTLSEDAKLITNIILTEAGEQLARDIEYIRNHPELKVMRPKE